MCGISLTGNPYGIMLFPGRPDSHGDPRMYITPSVSFLSLKVKALDGTWRTVSRHMVTSASQRVSYHGDGFLIYNVGGVRRQ